METNDLLDPNIANFKAEEKSLVGGIVIENTLSCDSNTGALIRQLWCTDGRQHSSECAVYADPDGASDVQPGDMIWWLSSTIFWSRLSSSRLEFAERKIRKFGPSFNPRHRR